MYKGKYSLSIDITCTIINNNIGYKFLILKVMGKDFEKPS